MNQIMQLAERLSTVKQFELLPMEDLVKIISTGDILHFAKGDFVFHQGLQCAGMFVLIEGQVNLYKEGPEGQVSILNTLSPVIMFNEVAVLDGGVNPVSCVTISDVTTWRIRNNRFQELVLHYPQIGISLLTILAKRNRQLIAHYDDLSFLTVQSRLAKLLIEISIQGTQPIDRSQHPVKTIAARIVTAPEAVSRIFKTFTLEDTITCTRKEIKVKNLKPLQNLAQIDF